ncbi:nitrous oxide reductase accessory protein NosL/NosD [Salinadaptatus halalkaliphilus]|uniref:Nitrous oxide reductase accessory protein NosL/NosD n=1 Tax=Salinadaptatus halalkaliphilus TaxID=2419781 RepID=A0A4S3TNC0_9EURY|nr:NosD domain-containing protein [Salinadaptatus halalkaliphilus]THE64713.1 nitrous oxide reductase accessory protein NosL/NosD [Salinadaptatus halalkaliphilus]
MLPGSRGSLLVIVLVVGAGCTLGLFVIDTAASDPAPVPFGDTVTMGVSLESDPDLGEDITIPKAQVYYTQYEYVVGYRGVERFVDASQQPSHEDRFGTPMAVSVTDFSETDLELSAAGYPTTDDAPDWTSAEDALYVVGSAAQTPAGATVVPFSERDDADAFAAAHGGTVRTWNGLLEAEFDIDDAEMVREQVDRRHHEVDARVTDAQQRRDRPVEVVVGDDTATVQAAIETAPPESTVLVPNGTYDEHVEIDRPITLAGAGDATIRGNGTETVVTVTADRAAVADLQIDGVGNTTQPEPEDDPADAEDVLEMAYGHGDAGIEVDDANRPLVENVSIRTPATGILLRESPNATIRTATVVSTADDTDGSMGVLTMRSPDTVVADATLANGRDGVYAHRSDGLVVRHSSLENHRIGVHLMYTSEVILADNEITTVRSSAIDVMTAPEHNAIVGNRIRDATQGVVMAGSHSYVAENVITDTDVGITTGAGNSIYERNVVAGNADGVQASQLLPTNEVVDNDFVANHRHATAQLGSRRHWTAAGSGNYWHGAVGASDGRTLERSYAPTDPVDERLHRVDGAATLTRAPALDAQASVEGAVAGLRGSQVVDTAPRCEPANPDLLEEAGWASVANGCGDVR